jgi:hypothetical protein
MRRRPSCAAALAVAALLQACQSVAEPPPRLLAERSAVQCPLRQPLAARGLVAVDSATQWQALLERPEAEVLGAPVAWATSRVLVLGLGPQATGGHRVEWVPPPRVDAQGLLAMQARHVAPAPDAMVTQAFAAPCLVVVLQRQGWQRAELAWVR